jgi:hypothetical protein
LCDHAPEGKEGNVNGRSFTFGSIAGLMLWTSVASAQTAPAAAQTASQSSANIDASFSNILSHLHFAAMGSQTSDGTGSLRWQT